jgi:hypothetical protein
MITHEHVRMQQAAAGCGGLARALQIKAPIDIVEEASRAIVATLYDV